MVVAAFLQVADHIEVQVTYDIHSCVSGISGPLATTYQANLFCRPGTINDGVNEKLLAQDARNFNYACGTGSIIICTGGIVVITGRIEMAAHNDVLIGINGAQLRGNYILCTVSPRIKHLG